jgi:hypothetical protein
MRRLLISLTAALTLGLPSAAAHSASASTKTVRGTLSVRCRKTGKFEGKFEVLLAGKPISKLTEGCAPGTATNHIYIDKVLHSPKATTLIVNEGFNASLDHAKLLYIPKAGPGAYVEFATEDEAELTQKTPQLVEVEATANGYPITIERMDHWLCVIDVDFAAGRAKGKLSGEHVKGLTSSVCEATIVKVPL